MPRSYKGGREPLLDFLPEHWLPYSFSVLANRVSDTLREIYSARFGLSVIGWRLAALLGSHEPLSAKQLAQLTAMDKVSVTRAIDRLEASGVVTRTQDPEDGRKVVLRLSEHGRNAYEEMIPYLHQIESELVSPLSEKQRAELHQMMELLVRHSDEVLSGADGWRQRLVESAIRDGARRSRGNRDT